MHLLILLLAPTLFLTARLHEVTGLGRSVGDMAADAPTPATPAGYAFLIWLVIFALFTAVAVHQSRAQNRNALIYRRIRMPFVVALAAAHGWMLTAQLHGNGLALLILIAVMAGGLFTALARAIATVRSREDTSAPTRNLVLPALALGSGWLTLATFLNLAGTLQLTLKLPTGSTFGAIATIALAATVGLGLFRHLRPLPTAAVPYAAALLWGLLAVVLANANPALSPIGIINTTVGYAALFAAIALLPGLALVPPLKTA